jgi:hypothetical protein
MLPVARSSSAMITSVTVQLFPTALPGVTAKKAGTVRFVITAGDGPCHVITPPAPEPQLTSAPDGKSPSSVTSVSFFFFLAASSMPLDSTPRIVAGVILLTTTIMRSIRLSGS